ncbi:MAG: CoA transferase subunit A [Deltaproteobacteria bacterium]|nr:MAG: CoA transferase subunit A [Deltaproteobacteria bacterium]
MIDKRTSLEKAVENIRDGDCIMTGGFGVPGTPFVLIGAVLKKGASELTLIKNEANEDHMGVSKLIEAGRVRKLICSHLGLNATVIGMMNRGEIEVEFYPQGILAEKIRAGGAGLAGILTDIGIDTILMENKQCVEVDGQTVIIEPALRGDVALIHAAIADPFGNLVYEKSARNFNPLMATAANTVIAEVEKIVEVGALDPDSIHTPGAFVDHVVLIKEITQEYEILRHHAL